MKGEKNTSLSAHACRPTGQCITNNASTDAFLQEKVDEICRGWAAVVRPTLRVQLPEHEKLASSQEPEGAARCASHEGREGEGEEGGGDCQQPTG